MPTGHDQTRPRAAVATTVPTVSVVPAGRAAPDVAAPRRLVRSAAGPAHYDLVLVGGVPGAGKTTAIARAIDDLAHVGAIDPEHVSWWLRRRLPGWVPYRAYRWIVHLGHTLRVLLHLLNGPVAGRRLVIHDPGTRAGRRRLFLGLAHLAGWRTVLLYVDVDRPAAQAGQVRRGRVVRSFDEHWQNWQRLRPALMAAPDQIVPAGATAEPVILTDRANAANVLRRICLAA